MTEPFSAKIEIAKLRATYWNNIAVATFIAGGIPLLITLDPIIKTKNATGWEPFAASSSALFLAFCLSYLLRTIGERSLENAGTPDQ